MQTDVKGAFVPLYQELLQERFASLPAAVRSFHDTPVTGRVWTGKANVRRGESPLAGFVCTLFGLPAEGDGVQLILDVRHSGDRECWTRLFGRQKMVTSQRLCRVRGKVFLVETIGLLTAVIELALVDERLRIDIVGSRMFGLPLPRLLSPTGTSYEYEVNGHYRFDVHVNLPLIGRLISYSGYLQPSEDAGTVPGSDALD